MADKNGKPEAEGPNQFEEAKFQLADEFKHLAGAPMAEIETCDTLPIVSIDLSKKQVSKSESNPTNEAGA